METGSKKPVKSRPPERPQGGPLQKLPAIWLWGLLILAGVLFLWHANSWMRPLEISYSEFLRVVDEGRVEEVEFHGQQLAGKVKQDTVVQDVRGQKHTVLKDGRFQTTILPVQDDELLPMLRKHKVSVR